MSSSSPILGPPDMVVKNRLLGFLLWQSIPSTFVYFLFKLFVSPISPAAHSRKSPDPFVSLLTGFLTFLTFHISQLLFSAALSLLASPQLDRPASPLELALGLFRFLLVPSSASKDFRRRATVSLYFVLYVVATAVSGSFALVSLCWDKSYGVGWWLIRSVWLRGVSIGLIYGCFNVYRKRLALSFPIIQRPPFFSFKRGLALATAMALKLSAAAYIISAVFVALLPDNFARQIAVRKFIADHAIGGSFAVFLCWELIRHLHWVIHTKRFTFAPPKGSAAAETNPSVYLLAALEESHPGSLLQYLAYLDLCMVCENNVDTWRRAAFFEETGETYKKVISISLRPLQQFAVMLGEGLEGSVDKASQLSKQLLPPKDSHLGSKQYETLENFQLYSWCARTVSMLTARSHEEDRFGVAQLSGSTSIVISTLLSCLLAAEVLMGKKTNLESSLDLFGPTFSIRRARPSARKTKTGPHHSKSYAFADVLRTSVYLIVSAFHDEMLKSAKSGCLEKDWIAGGKPLFGSRELLLQKLESFLDFRG